MNSMKHRITHSPKYHRRKRIHAIVTVGLMLTIFYFCYHAIQGERGLRALIELEKELEITTASLDNIRAERLALEHRVNHLRTDALDLDLLDEQVRKLLGFAGRNEAVYLRN